MAECSKTNLVTNLGRCPISTVQEQPAAIGGKVAKSPTFTNLPRHAAEVPPLRRAGTRTGAYILCHFSGDEVTSTDLSKYFRATPTTSSIVTAWMRSSNALS